MRCCTGLAHSRIIAFDGFGLLARRMYPVQAARMAPGVSQLRGLFVPAGRSARATAGVARMPLSPNFIMAARKQGWLPVLTVVNLRPSPRRLGHLPVTGITFCSRLQWDARQCSTTGSIY